MSIVHCDVLAYFMSATGETNTEDCWCLWGTINYSFCAYTAGMGAANSGRNQTLGDGRCPAITGESLSCSDLSSLGNCYDGHYICRIDAAGLCDCQTD